MASMCQLCRYCWPGTTSRKLRIMKEERLLRSSPSKYSASHCFTIGAPEDLLCRLVYRPSVAGAFVVSGVRTPVHRRQNEHALRRIPLLRGGQHDPVASAVD